MSIELKGSDRLLARLDIPNGPGARALVLLVHGLGSSSQGPAVRRLALRLQEAGCAVLRLNLRGAGPGRPWAGGSYAAACNRDLMPVLVRARRLAAGLAGDRPPPPLLGVGISLGGTVLLNAVLLPEDHPGAEARACLDGLVCLGAPLDLAACSERIEHPRNRLYRHWILQRLRQETLQDPRGVTPAERASLSGLHRVRTVRAFDAAITAPRWGFASVAEYYRMASPLERLLEVVRGADPTRLAPLLLLHAGDDPWVPAEAAGILRQALERRGPGGRSPLDLVLPRAGGHVGFHGPDGCWSDALTVAWLNRFLAARRDTEESAFLSG